MRSLLLQREDYKEVSEGQSVHLCGVVCACMYTDLCSFVSTEIIYRGIGNEPN